MSFHLLNYFVSAGAGDANVDMIAAVDDAFSRRNNHYIFSEPWNLIAWSHLAASATRARLNVPSINAYARHQVWPVNRSAIPPSYPRIADYRDFPIPLPRDEEVAVEESNNLGMGNEDTTSFLWIADPGWNRNLPRGLMRINVRVTAAATIVGDAWSAFAALTFAENLRGGWYSVVAAYCQSTALRAFRLMFPRMPLIAGRLLRPGALVTNAVGDLQTPDFNEGLGVWGSFHTFEPPQIQVYGDTSGADTQEIRLDLIYHGDTAPAGYR